MKYFAVPAIPRTFSGWACMALPSLILCRLLRLYPQYVSIHLENVFTVACFREMGPWSLVTNRRDASSRRLEVDGRRECPSVAE